MVIINGYSIVASYLSILMLIFDDKKKKLDYQFRVNILRVKRCQCVVLSYNIII